MQLLFIGDGNAMIGESVYYAKGNDVQRYILSEVSGDLMVLVQHVFEGNKVSIKRTIMDSNEARNLYTDKRKAEMYAKLARI
jgi:hypothetical protein